MCKWLLRVLPSACADKFPSCWTSLYFSWCRPKLRHSLCRILKNTTQLSASFLRPRASTQASVVLKTLKYSEWRSKQNEHYVGITGTTKVIHDLFVLHEEFSCFKDGGAPTQKLCQNNWTSVLFVSRWPIRYIWCEPQFAYVADQCRPSQRTNCFGLLGPFHISTMVTDESTRKLVGLGICRFVN